MTAELERIWKEPAATCLKVPFSLEQRRKTAGISIRIISASAVWNRSFVRSKYKVVNWKHQFLTGVVTPCGCGGCCRSFGCTYILHSQSPLKTVTSTSETLASPHPHCNNSRTDYQVRMLHKLTISGQLKSLAQVMSAFVRITPKWLHRIPAYRYLHCARATKCVANIHNKTSPWYHQTPVFHSSLFRQELVVAMINEPFYVTKHLRGNVVSWGSDDAFGTWFLEMNLSLDKTKWPGMPQNINLNWKIFCPQSRLPVSSNCLYHRRKLRVLFELFLYSSASGTGSWISTSVASTGGYTYLPPIRDSPMMLDY